MHRNKIIILAILLSFIAALPVAGASTTVTLKPIVSATTKAAGEAVAQLTKLILPPLAALVIDYYKPKNVLSFEITPERATTKTSDGTTYEQEGPRLPTPYYCPKPFISISKPYKCALRPNYGIQFAVPHCNDTLHHKHYQYWHPTVMDDGRIDLTIFGSTVLSRSQASDSLNPYRLQWNSVPLPYDGITTDKSCDLEIVDYDPVVGGGSKIVGYVYNTNETQDVVTWKTLTQVLSAPLPPMSDSSSSSSSAPVFAYVG